MSLSEHEFRMLDQEYGRREDLRQERIARELAMTGQEMDGRQARERVALEQDYRQLVAINQEMLEALEVCKRALFNGYIAAQLDGETLPSKAFAMAEAATRKAKSKP